MKNVIMDDLIAGKCNFFSMDEVNVAKGSPIL